MWKSIKHQARLLVCGKHVLNATLARADCKLIADQTQRIIALSYFMNTNYIFPVSNDYQRVQGEGKWVFAQTTEQPIAIDLFLMNIRIHTQNCIEKTFLKKN